MFYKKLDESRWYLRLERGEEVVVELKKFVQEQAITAGHVQGLGGLSQIELGVYHLSSTKKYDFQEFHGDLELTNLTGNIASSDDGPLLHLHATIGTESLQAFAGHVNRATVAGTVEIFVQKFTARFEREPDDDVGLSLLSFKDE